MPTITPSAVSLVNVGDWEPSATNGPEPANPFAESEIQHLHRAVFPYFDIRWFQIAMDDPLLVRRLESLRDLPENGESFLPRDRTFRDAFGERRAFDQLEDDGADAVTFFEAVDTRNIRMVQRRKDLGLTPEPVDTRFVLRKGIGQHFERHVAAELCIARAVDFTHAARANGRKDFIGAEARTYFENHEDQAIL